MSKPPTEAFKLQRGEPEQEDSPNPEEGLSNFHGRKPTRRYHPRGWARTGLEPEIVIFLNDAPFDALISMSNDYSMIDPDLCRYLQLDVTPFKYEIPLCMSVEGECIIKPILAVLGWVELEIGIASVGLAKLKFWVADCVASKGAPFILGTNQIKSIFNQVDNSKAESWPQPWRSMHYRFFYGNWSDSDTDDLYDSDDYDTEYEEEDSYDALCRFEAQMTPSTFHSSLDSWLKDIEYPAPTKEPAPNPSKEEGIPGLEPNENGNLIPAAKAECSFLDTGEECPDNGGGEISVFTNLAVESEGSATEVKLPACNVKGPSPSAGPLSFGKL